MERREALAGIGALAAMTLAATAQAADHQHDHHHDHAQANPRLPLVRTAADCIRTGEACLDHCFTLLGKGDTEMAACARSVNELLAVCAALQRLATANSRFLASYARVAGEICENCEKECRKHEKKHVQCKDCAEACAACLKECRGIAA